ncbi:MAG: helix-turn-helix transcriptional regulator [bacterium]
MKKISQEIQRLLEELKDDPEFKLERLMLEINEDICRFMEERGITRAELAEKLGTSRAYITKMLNGNPNLTLRSLVNIAHALECEINIRFFEKETRIPNLSVYRQQKSVKKTKKLAFSAKKNSSKKYKRM